MRRETDRYWADLTNIDRRQQRALAVIHKEGGWTQRIEVKGQDYCDLREAMEGSAFHFDTYIKRKYDKQQERAPTGATWGLA